LNNLRVFGAAAVLGAMVPLVGLYLFELVVGEAIELLWLFVLPPCVLLGSFMAGYLCRRGTYGSIICGYCAYYLFFLYSYIIRVEPRVLSLLLSPISSLMFFFYSIPAIVGGLLGYVVRWLFEYAKG
jgi:hypothetical protein